ncbi:MAG: S66 peptidase family protein [Flavicella sp.]
MKTPAFLKKGDRIAIVAPAGIIKNPVSVHEAKKVAESWGLHVTITPNVFEKNNHFAGTDQQRIEDFQWALDASDIKAIWCARGGYGSIRVIDALNFDSFKKNPKWIVGYSDITVFHNYLQTENYASIHGCMPVNMEFPVTQRTESFTSLKKALFGNLKTYSVKGSKHNRIGQAEGILVGGNLSLLASMSGSKIELDTEGKILFIEEIGEYKYHIDRLLRTLKRNGSFEKCNGIIVGGMSKLKHNNPSFGKEIETVILEAIGEHAYPVLFNFPAGHDPINKALYFGKKIQLQVTKGNGVIHFK